ncbi:LysR family transcriptional regulator [Agrobacterium rhizogenes]|uniref:LysR family transcriptional regulator n=1 Tax=Rhizobium rhizogenes TaxID=359 RepID=UPI0015725744|nr:LysR family transcriptional regulator [Rhizobium rhizogenes]NTH16783.1 LysR family transcriptional regulator [Rhizobium rhizogenes]
MLNLVHLRSFVVLASELNFSRAAKRLNMTQPPLSRQIALLESHLGVHLFDRTSRSVALTTAGSGFLPEARALLQQVTEAEQVARRPTRLQEGGITLGFMGITSYSFLPRFLARAQLEYPNITVTLKELTGALQLEALEFRQIDLGLVRPIGPDTKITSRCVMRRGLVLALPIQHHLAKRQRLTLKDVHDQPFIMYHADAPYMHGILKAAFEANNVQPQFVQQMTHAQVILSLVSVGMGIAIVPEETQAACFDNIVFRPISLEREVLAETHIMWRVDDRNPILPLFIDLAGRLEGVANM